MTTATVKAQQPINPVAVFTKFNMQLVMVFIALVIIYACSMFAAPDFAQAEVFTDVPLQAAYIGVMTLGATFVIATAGIDLSVDTDVTLAVVMMGVLSSADWIDLPLGVGLTLVLLPGTFIGLANGVDISILGFPLFIAILAMMMVARGLALIIPDRSTILIVNKDYIALPTSSLFPTVGGATLTNTVFILVLLTILATFLLSKTLLGRYALTIGSNEGATRLSGVNARLWKVVICVIAGVFMIIGVILYSACFGFVQPVEGAGFEFNVITATVTGDTSLSGGHTSIPGILLGMLVMETLKKGLTMVGVASERQLVAIGVAALLAVFTDNIRRAHENTT